MILSSLRGVILDMDGVVVDSEAQWRRLERPMLRDIAPGWKDSDFGRLVGLSAANLYRLLIAEYGMTMSEKHFMDHCNRLATEVYSRHVTLAPGLRHFLSELEERAVPTAIASSSQRAWIQLVLDRFQLRSRFKAVVSVDDVSGESKPSPAIYHRATALLGIAPAQCMTVEDSLYGVLSAKRAGIACVAGFRNGGNAEQDLSLADFEVHGFSQLHRMLQSDGQGKVSAHEAS